MKRLDFLTIFFLLFAISNTAFPEIIGWWPLDEGAGFVAYDYSGFDHDGSIGSNQSWNSQGSLDFVGYTPSNAENSITFLPEDANEIFQNVHLKMMISCWIKLYEPFELSKAFYCMRDGEIVSYVEFQPELGGILRYKPNPETDCVVNGILDSGSSNYIDMSQWNHFLFVRDLEDDTAEIYLNGSLLDTRVYGSGPYAALTGIDDFIIAGFENTGHFKGSIKDFKIYNDSDKCCIDINVQPDAAGPYTISPGQQLTFDGNDCYTDSAFGYGTSWYVDDYLFGQGGGVCNDGNCCENVKVSVTYDELVEIVGYGKHQVRLDMISYNANFGCKCQKSDTTTIMVIPEASFGQWGSPMLIKNNHSISPEDCNCVAHCKMNDDPGQKVVFDSTLNGKDGTATNDIISIKGKVNNAIDFDGISDQIRIHASTELFNQDANRSISLWIKAPPAQPCQYPRIYSKKKNMYMYSTNYGNPGSNTYFCIHDGVNPAGKVIIANDLIYDDSWHLIVIIVDRDNDLMAAYIDGVLRDTDNISDVGDTSNSASSFYLGSYGDSYYLQGALDDVRFFKKALCQEEIDFIYNNGNGTEDAIPGEFSGVDGSNCVDSNEVIFQGYYLSAADLHNNKGPIQNGWSYYNKTNKKYYVQQNSTWYQMDINQTNNQDPNSLDIVWHGQASVPDVSWQVQNHCYRDNENNLIYIYNGFAWELLALDGSDEQQGTGGDDQLSIFVTYCDNPTDAPPVIPTGDGTASPWHTDATSLSNWMSQKIAAFADIQSDGLVNLVDFAKLAQAWQTSDGQSDFDPACDISKPADGIIDSDDLSAFSDYWLIGN